MPMVRNFQEGSNLWLETWEHERTTVVLEKEDIQVGGPRESWSLQDALTLPVDDWIKEWIMGNRAVYQLEKTGALLGIHLAEEVGILIVSACCHLDLTQVGDALSKSLATGHKFQLFGPFGGEGGPFGAQIHELVEEETRRNRLEGSSFREKFRNSRFS